MFRRRQLAIVFAITVGVFGVVFYAHAECANEKATDEKITDACDKWLESDCKRKVAGKPIWCTSGDYDCVEDYTDDVEVTTYESCVEESDGDGQICAGSGSTTTVEATVMKNVQCSS